MFKKRGQGTFRLAFKYAPDGDRVYRKIINDTTTESERYYVVDNAGKYSQILLEINTADDTIAKTYIYAHNQVIAQHDITYNTETPPVITDDDVYYYLHDRLGSVRMLIDESGAVQNYYTYDPFGKLFDNESNATISNPYRFASYFWDDEIAQYYCRARQYDPQLQRFTSIDPVRGSFQEPLTLHQYLYCLNNPINLVDLDGLMAELLIGNTWGAKIQQAWNRAAISIGSKISMKVVIYTTVAALATTYAILEAEHFMSLRRMKREYARNNPESTWKQIKNNLKDPRKWGLTIGTLLLLHESLREGCDTSEWEKIISETDQKPNNGPEGPILEQDKYETNDLNHNK
ncbi:RHS repeat domain-containing protein [Planctomycetota bacterium]